ncbi:MAG: helix-turn-helix transcriptional regulator [Clostridiaceae bacterium]
MDTRKKIKQTRVKKGISTYKLAEIITKNGFKISQSAISKIENGNKKIDVTVLDEIAKALEVNVSEFLEDTIIQTIDPLDLFAGPGKLFSYPDDESRLKAISCISYLMEAAGVDKEKREKRINSLADYELDILITELLKTLEYELFKLKKL